MTETAPLFEEPQQGTPLRPWQIPAAARMHAEPTPAEQAAAALVQPRLGTLRFRALEAFRAAGRYGLTDFELADAMDTRWGSAAPRRTELMKAGWVESAGKMRPNAETGAMAGVYRLTEAGRRAS